MKGVRTERVGVRNGTKTKPHAEGGGDFPPDHGGTMEPPEIMSFMPSPTLMVSSRTSARGTSIRKPLVGLGEVGTKTAQISSAISACGSPGFLLVRNPIYQVPARGNSTSTTLENELCPCRPKVATICLTVL